jgi:hypothetical protein
MLTMTSLDINANVGDGFFDTTGPLASPPRCPAAGPVCAPHPRPRRGREGGHLVMLEDMEGAGEAEWLVAVDGPAGGELAWLRCQVSGVRCQVPGPGVRG